MKQAIYSDVPPVIGAARYYAGIDHEKGNKPCVCMEVPPDEKTKEFYYYVLSHHKTVELAKQAATRWQIRENKSVLKNHKL